MGTELFRNPPNAWVENSKDSNDTAGSNCEVSFCDARYTATGDRTFLNTGTKRYFDAPRKTGLAYAALSVTKFYDKKNILEYTETSIRSAHIKTALKEVVPSDYPGLNLTSETLVMRDFLECVYFYHQELREYGKNLKDKEAALHVDLVLKHLYRGLGHNIDTFRENVEENLEDPEGVPVLDFENLWMVFCPGDLVAVKGHNKHLVYQVVSTEYVDLLFSHPHLHLMLRSFQCNGDHFGFVNTVRAVSKRQCHGFTPLEELPVLPLGWLQETQREDILSEARVRGERFIGLSTGIHHCEYDGLAEVIPCERGGYESEELTITRTITGRIMIDSNKFAKMCPMHVPRLGRERLKYKVKHVNEELIPDQHLLTVSGELLGFSLARKSWCVFDIDLCQPVRYNWQAFSKLVLPTSQKDMIRSLVTAQKNGDLGFDDIIQGKGKGITLLLHGTPGVGKTLTAESVAEHARKPLYAVTAAEFAEKVSVTERKLNDVFDLAAHWEAILLIDEADVILTRRTYADVERNAVVAVFLRALEYYSGVLILTTNRVTDLDTAFRSRIHLGIKYNPLSAATRKKIWQTFINQYTGRKSVELLHENTLKEMSEYEFDGRMIKNAVRMAHAVATDEGVDLNVSHMRKAIRSLQDFKQDMELADEEEEEAQEGVSALTKTSSRKRKRTSSPINQS
ncbi:P-loop containing nucleoside triphosphate hydrolase protein [Alternaria alternata]|nr:P-loop containing nucleoside triphosphate hydrolase protein [Alternaria alternata]RYN78353.1 hypothetical protein AA0120_g11022 [Alternaria tenuissima]